MSAFLCSNKHLSTIVRAAIPGSGVATFPYGDKRLTRKELGQLLLDENIRSLKARYGDRHGVIESETRFRMELVEYPDPVAAIKLINSYQYQACESDDWEQTEAYKVSEAIKDGLTRHLPGYDDAPWSI